MGRRAYRRNSRGQFAGSGGRVTYGRAGGFANAAHRARAVNAKASKRQANTLAAKRVKQTRTTLMVTAGTVLAVGAVRVAARAWL